MIQEKSTFLGRFEPRNVDIAEAER